MAPETCPKCSKPKSSQPGSLTQWIIVCSCEQLPYAPGPNQSEAIIRCRTCAKPIREQRPGSLTQWIFHEDSCNCDRPVVDYQPPSSEFKQNAFRGFDDLDKIEIEVDKAKFPLERYKPVEILGSGVSGTVYLSRDRVLEKRVAVKVLRILEREALLAFQNEAKTTSRLSHPNIIKVLDFGSTDGGVPFMVMEYIDGENLATLISKNNGVDLESAISIFIQLAEALNYAHESDIMHRDLKPGNILIVENEGTLEAHLIDFGVAKLKSTQDSTMYNGTALVGTPAYMSPDQALGRNFDHRSDLYSLGCVMFEALTGRQTFYADTALQTVSLHANQMPPSILEFIEPTPATEAIESIVARCLEKDPDLRFQSGKELSLALKAIPLDDETGGESDYASASSQNQSRSSGKLYLPIALGSACTVLMFGWLSNSIITTQLEKTEERKKADSGVTRTNTKDNTIKKLNRSMILHAGRVGLAAEVERETDKSLKTLLRDHKAIGRAAISRSKISPDGFRLFKPLHLTELIIGKGQTTTPAHFKAISELTELTKLKFEPDDDIDLSGLSELRNSKTLLDLNFFNQTRVNQQLLNDLSEVKTVQRLKFENCGNFANLSLSPLASLPNLHALDLSSSDVTDATLKSMPLFKHLEFLTLSHTEITKEGLKPLTKTASLKFLRVLGCPNISLQDLDVLKRSKNLIVDHDMRRQKEPDLPRYYSSPNI